MKCPLLMFAGPVTLTFARRTGRSGRSSSGLGPTMLWMVAGLPCARSNIFWIAPRTFPSKTLKIYPNIGRGLCFRWQWAFWPGCQIVSIQNRSIEFATCSQNSMNVPGIVWPGPNWRKLSSSGPGPGKPSTPSGKPGKFSTSEVVVSCPPG